MTLMEFLGEMTSCTLDAVSMAPHRCPGSVTTASTRHAVMSNSFMNNHNAQLTMKPPSQWNINYLRQWVMRSSLCLYVSRTASKAETDYYCGWTEDIETRKSSVTFRLRSCTACSVYLVQDCRKTYDLIWYDLIWFDLHSHISITYSHYIFSLFVHFWAIYYFSIVKSQDCN